MTVERSESAITAAIRRLLKRRGAYAVKIFGSGRGRIGVPDILASYRGRFIGVEVKQRRGVVSAIQDHEMRQIRKSGGVAIAAKHEDEVEQVLDEIDAELGPLT